MLSLERIREDISSSDSIRFTDYAIFVKLRLKGRTKLTLVRCKDLKNV